MKPEIILEEKGVWHIGGNHSMVAFDPYQYFLPSSSNFHCKNL